MSKSEEKTRTRNYASILYPESAPENWLDILRDEHIKVFVSPLHNRDVTTEGELKKEHYHIIIMFDGVKTFEQAKEIFVKIGGVGLEVVKSIRGYARYLCHLDHPEKAQYNPDDVISICGADYNNICSIVVDKYKVIRAIIEWCKETNCYSYADLLEYSAVNKNEWFRVLCDNGTIVVKEYLKSRKWTNDKYNKI